MPFDYQLSAELFLQNQTFRPKPFITGWNRLEGRVRMEEFERALRAEVRDPLWFLARQWQFLELKADDAGSPIETRIALRQTKLGGYAPRGGPAQTFPSALPLETVVEREAAPLDRVALMQVHRAFDKALVRDGVPPLQRAQGHAQMRGAYPLAAATLDGVEDVEARQLAALADRQLFDAATFLAEVATNAF